MASLSSRGKGASRSFVVQWNDAAGVRRTLTLGRVPKPFAERFYRGVERLADSVEYDQPLDRKTSDWLAELAPRWRQKLADKGLASAATVTTLGELCSYAIEQSRRRENAARTIEKLQQAQTNLLEFFEPDRLLHAVTEGDAEEFLAWLRTKAHQRTGGGLAESTAAVRALAARQFFEAAVKHRWLAANPFGDLKGLRKEQEKAGEYVPVERVLRVMEHAPPDMRVMLALSRFGGVRCPSEALDLKREWVNPTEGTVNVYSRKNRRFKHKRDRVIPLYACLRPYLEEALELAPEGSVYVVEGRLREVTSTAIYNRLERLCKRAGEVPWDNLWQSLRQSRATDLIDEGFPEHVVCYWQNDNPRTLRRHYLRVTKEHYARALSTAAAPAGDAAKEPAAR